MKKKKHEDNETSKANAHGLNYAFILHPSSFILPPSSFILPPNPFPGLRPFRCDEHHLFFGREDQTAALLQLLRQKRFLAVVGTSGSGKSSLVQAGMIAELYGGTMTQAGSSWEVILLRPGGSPIGNLARALVAAGLYDVEDPETLPRLLATLRRSRFGLVEAIKQSDVFEPGANLLVVVDQFEELFRFRQHGVGSEEAAAAFVNLLLTASEQAECPIYVTLTMRSDYLGDCSEIPGLAEAVNQGEYLIPRLLRDQKRDAIEKPIGVGGAKISPLLVQRLLNDVGDDPDQLPVLQHALMRMWDVWSAGSDHARPIELGDFEATGGLASALSNHADEIYAALPGELHRDVCERVFKTLTEKGTDNRGIRRPTRLSQLEAIAGADRVTMTTVLDAYRRSGVTFVMPGIEHDLRDQTVLDLSHESLMRGWQRLRNWVEDEAQSARIFRRLSDTASLWRNGQAGLFRDPDLQIALSWREQQRPSREWAEQYNGQLQVAMDFLDASNADAQAELQAKEAAREHELEQAQQLAEARQLQLEQQQRSARKLRKLIASLAVVAVLAGFACVAALIANNNAHRLAKLADREAAKANQSQQETASALAVVESQKAEVEASLTKAEVAERRALAAVEAGRKLQYTTDMQLAPFVWNDDRSTAEQLRTLLAKHDPNERMKDEGGRMNKTDSSFILPPSSFEKSDLRGFEWDYYKQLLDNSAAVFSGHGTTVADGAFTSDGQLVTLDQNGQVRRWDVDSRVEDEASRRDLPNGRGAQVRVLSPNGRLAALAEGNRVHVFDTATGQEMFPIDSFVHHLLLFSPASDMLVFVDDKIRWYDAVNGRAIASVDRIYKFYRSLALSADGLTLAVVGHGPGFSQFSIFRLDATTGKVTPRAQDVVSNEMLSAAAFSSDGELIAVGTMQVGCVRVFETATGRLIAEHLSAHASPISAIAFFKGGAKLVTADVAGTIRIWEDAQQLNSKSTALLTLKGHEGAITNIRFSSDGKQLVSTSADQTARVWDPENLGAAIRPLEWPLEGANAQCFVARFSPNGQLIAAADSSSVRLWDAATGQLVRELSAGDQSRVYSVAFSPTDNRLLAVGFGEQADVSHVELWDIDAGTKLARLPGAIDLPSVGPEKHRVGALAFSPDGKYLVAGFGAVSRHWSPGSPNPLKVWEVATRRLIRRLNHTSYCVSLDFSTDGTLLASGSFDGAAMIWSTATWKATQRLRNPDPPSETSQGMGGGIVDDVAFSPDGTTLAMASRGGNVLLWDVATGKLLETLKGHSNAVTAVVFSPNGRTLASGSYDQSVRLWNVETRRELMQLDSGGIELGPLETLAFSADGKHLLAGGSRTALWSTAPIVWNDPARAAEKLELLLQSNADFQSRIRMLSENLRLHEALEKLDSADLRVQAALAATRANWHASRRRWADAAREFDRLRELSPDAPQAWLRTPGLIRVARALVEHDRPAIAAGLLAGGVQRRIADGAAVGLGFDYSNTEGVVRVTKLIPGSPAARSHLLPGDVVLTVNDVKLTADTIPKLSGLLDGEVGTTIRLTVRQAASDGPEELELVRATYFSEPAIGEWETALRAATDQRLVKDPLNPGLLELRAELAGQRADYDEQVADYSAAIEALAARPVDDAAADVARLFRRRGDAYLRLKNWQQAADDYARVVTDETTDEDLLAHQALARAGVLLGSIDSPAQSITNPWAKLAAAYQWHDDQQLIDKLVEKRPHAAGSIGDLFAFYKDWERAIELYSQGINALPRDVELLSRRARAYEQVQNWEAATADWSRAAADGLDRAKLLAEFAKRLAEAGQSQLAAGQYEKSQQLYEQSLEADTGNSLIAEELTQFLFDRKETTQSVWTVLKPTEMKSDGGAELTLQQDGSILAGGKNPPSDRYQLAIETDLKTIAALRLEALLDGSLPGRGPGRGRGGHFIIDQLTVDYSEKLASDKMKPLPLAAAAANRSQETKINPSSWNIGGGGAPGDAYFAVDPSIHSDSGFRFTFSIQRQQNPAYSDENLGRFRLSISEDPQAFEQEKIRLAALKITDPWVKLAAAYHLLDDQPAVEKLLQDHPEAAVGIVAFFAEVRDSSPSP